MESVQLFQNVKLLLANPMNQAAERVERALLPFIGAFLKFTVGTATSDTTKELKDKIKHVESYLNGHSQGNMNRDEILVELSHAFLSHVSAFKLQNHRLAVGLTNFSLSVEKYINETASDILLIETTMLKAEAEAEFLADTENAIKMFLNYKVQLAAFLASVRQLHLGYITPDLIPPTLLKQAVDQHINKLRDQNPALVFLMNDVTPFYQTKVASYDYSDSYIYVHLDVPTSLNPAVFTLYQLIIFEIPIHSDKPNIPGHTILSHPAQIIAVTPNEHTFISLSPADLQLCHEGPYFTCIQNFPRQNRNSPTCLSSLFFGDESHIRSLCEFKLFPNQFPKQIFQHVYDGSYLVITRAETVTLHCSNETGSHPIQAFAILNVPCGCHALIGEFKLINSKFPCQETILHPLLLSALNLPVVSAFSLHAHQFDSNYIYNGHVSLDKIPDFNNILQKFSDLNPTSLALGLNLTKAAEALLHNDTIYDQNYVSYDEQESWLESLHLSGFSIAFYVISILTTVITLYTFCRVRTLALLIMVRPTSATPLLRELLKNHTARRTSPPLVLAPPTPKTMASINNAMEEWGGDIEELSKEMGDHISTIIVVSLIFYILFKLTKGTFAMIKFAIKPNVVPQDSLAPKLVLKIFYKDTCVPIPLKTLIYDLNILGYTHAPVLEDVTMTSCMANDVNLAWEAVTMPIKIANFQTHIELPTTARIPPLYRLFVYRAVRAKTRDFALSIVTSKGDCIQIPWREFKGESTPLLLLPSTSPGHHTVAHIDPFKKGVHTSLL